MTTRPPYKTVMVHIFCYCSDESLSVHWVMGLYECLKIAHVEVFNANRLRPITVQLYHRLSVPVLYYLCIIK